MHLEPKSHPWNQNGKQPKLQADTTQREHTINRVSSSFQKVSTQLPNQARRHVVKSGPAEVRARVEGTSEGKSSRGGFPPS